MKRLLSAARNALNVLDAFEANGHSFADRWGGNAHLELRQALREYDRQQRTEEKRRELRARLVSRGFEMKEIR